MCHIFVDLQGYLLKVKAGTHIPVQGTFLKTMFCYEIHLFNHTIKCVVFTIQTIVLICYLAAHLFNPIFSLVEAFTFCVCKLETVLGFVKLNVLVCSIISYFYFILFLFLDVNEMSKMCVF